MLNLFIDDYLCYYSGNAAKFNCFGQCTIPYSLIIDHYKHLWDAAALTKTFQQEAINGRRIQVSNDNPFIMTNHSCTLNPFCGQFQSNCGADCVSIILMQAQSLDYPFYH